jgi:hypothetical protein
MPNFGPLMFQGNSDFRSTLNINPSTEELITANKSLEVLVSAVTSDTNSTDSRASRVYSQHSFKRDVIQFKRFFIIDSSASHSNCFWHWNKSFRIEKKSVYLWSYEKIFKKKQPLDCWKQRRAYTQDSRLSNTKK